MTAAEDLAQELAALVIPGAVALTDRISPALEAALLPQMGQVRSDYDLYLNSLEPKSVVVRGARWRQQMAAGAAFEIPETALLSGATAVGVAGDRVRVGFEDLEQPIAQFVRERLTQVSGKVQVEVFETGHVHSLAGARRGATSSHGPVRPGQSTSLFNGGYGTVGAIVESELLGRAVISNAHVLALKGQDDVWIPRRGAGGRSAARLSQAVTPAVGTMNAFDAAIAQLKEDAPHDLSVEHINQPLSRDVIRSRRGLEGKRVGKVGASSGLTYGTIDLENTTTSCWYGKHLMTFTNQLQAIPDAGGVFSTTGDSGSVVWEEGTLRPIGLLYGGNRHLAWFSPIGPALDSFDASIF